MSAQSIAYAIFYTALGFARLAEFLPGSAAQAFQAAALFAAAGATAAVVGRAIAPRQEAAGAAGAAGAGGSAGSAGSASPGASGGPAGPSGPRIQIIVQGHIVGRYGIEELTELLNDAVQNRDVKLVATAVRRAQVITV